MTIILSIMLFIEYRQAKGIFAFSLFAASHFDLSLSVSFLSFIHFFISTCIVFVIEYYSYISFDFFYFFRTFLPTKD